MANPLTRGKIFLVPFPFDDLSATKFRPAVCLTEPVGVNRHIVVAFITSREVLDLQPTDIVLPASRSDFPMTGLRVNSVLRLHRLMTLSTKIIQRELGRLPPALEGEAAGKLGVLFGLQK